MTKEDFKYVEFERDVDLSQPLMVRSDKRNRINAIDIAFLYETAAELKYFSSPYSSVPEKLKLGDLKKSDLRAIVNMFCQAFYSGYVYSSSVYSQLVDHEYSITTQSFTEKLKNYRYDCASRVGANVIIPEGRDNSPLYADKNLVLADAIYDIERRFLYNQPVRDMLVLWESDGRNSDSFQSVKEEPYPVNWEKYSGDNTSLPDVNIYQGEIYWHWWAYGRSIQDRYDHTGFSIGGDGELYFWPYIEDNFRERQRFLYDYFRGTNFNIRTFVDIIVDRWHSSDINKATEHAHGYYRLEGVPNSSRSVVSGYMDQIAALGGLKDDHRQPLKDAASVESANANEDWDGGDYFYQPVLG